MREQLPDRFLDPVIAGIDLVVEGDDLVAELDVLRLQRADGAAQRPENDRPLLLHARLERAGLWIEVKDRLEEPGTGLSGGQQQRLCIARCLAVEPDVILMDEPASALDPISTTRIEDLMHELKREYTIVIVTHNMQQAARVADMTAFFSVEVDEPTGNRTGILVEYDKTAKIFTTPADKRTEDYVTGRFG